MKTTTLISILALAISGLAPAVVTVGTQGQGIQPADRTPFLTALGGTAAGRALFQLPNPGAVRYLQINADNTVSSLDAATFLSAIGGGSGGGGGNLTSGPVTSSSGVSSIADGALAIAKTNGLQTALDGKQPLITDGSITNARLATNPLARANHTGTQAWSTITATPTTFAGYGLSTPEPALGNPASNGYVLSSTTGGTRSWIAATGGDLTSGPVTSSGGVSAIADSALAIAKTSGLQTALDSKTPLVITGTNNNFVFEGDSETAGGALSAGQDFPEKVMLTSAFAGKGTKYNVAAGGELLTAMISEYAAEVYPKRPAANGGAPAYLFIWSGANDIGVVSAATEISNLESYWSNAKADGFTVIAFTVMRESTYSQVGEADRQTINSAIRKSTTYDYLVDTAALFPDPLDTNFFLGDGVHLTAAANLVLAREIQSVLLSKSGSKRADVTSTTFIAGPMKMGYGNTAVGGDLLSLSNPSTNVNGGTNLAVKTEWTPSGSVANKSVTGISSIVFGMGSSTTDAATSLIPYLATATYRGSGGGIGTINGFATHIGNQADLYGGSGQAVVNVNHFLAADPITSGVNAPITNLTGLFVAPQKVAGVTNGYGIYQQGTNDVNIFAGISRFTGTLVGKKGYGLGTALQIDASGGSATAEYNLNIKPYVVGAYDIGYKFNMVNNFTDIGDPFTITSAGVEVVGNSKVTSGDILTATAGKTIKIKSGTNAKAGTFTLSSGAATVSNTAVTANSVFKVTVKTVSGTRTGVPDIIPTAGTGFTATGAGTDNSTYNYVILEVN